MTRTERRQAAPCGRANEAANAARADRPADAPGVTADHSARAERIARIAAELEELANDGLIGDDERPSTFPPSGAVHPRGPRVSSPSPRT